MHLIVNTRHHEVTDGIQIYALKMEDGAGYSECKCTTIVPEK